MAQDGSDFRDSLTTTHDCDAERAVVGAALLGGGRAVDDAMEAGIRAGHFAIGQLRTMWSAIEEIHAAGTAVTMITVVDHLMHKGQLDAVGGAAAVSQLATLLESTAAIKAHARVVNDAATYRKLAEVGYEIQRAARDRDTSAADLLAEVQELVLEIGRRMGDDVGLVNRRETVERIMARIGKKAEGVLPTGFTELDDLLGGGLVPGNLIVVAARPGMGKSAFGQQLAAQVADVGVPTQMMSMEMTGDELLMREIAGEARCNIKTWTRRDEGGRAMSAAAKVAERPLFIIDRAGLDIAGVCSRVRRLVQREGVDLVVVDYVGLVRPAERYRGQRTNEIGEVTAALKELAQNLRIPVVALAQLNRDVEKRNDKHPQLSDLRDSGNIEQDANVVMFLYREEYYAKDKCPPEKERVCEVIVAKNRNGATGTAELIYDGPTTRFSNIKRK